MKIGPETDTYSTDRSLEVVCRTTDYGGVGWRHVHALKRLPIHEMPPKGALRGTPEYYATIGGDGKGGTRFRLWPWPDTEAELLFP